MVIDMCNKYEYFVDGTVLNYNESNESVENTGKKFECPQCGEAFMENEFCLVDNDDLDITENTENGENYVECPCCGYREQKTSFDLVK